MRSWAFSSAARASTCLIAACASIHSPSRNERRCRLAPVTMRTADFDFDLPEAQIARAPAVPRDAARLLVIGDTLQDRQVHDLPSLVRPGDLMVFNDTKVIPAQLTGRRTADAVRGEATIEVTLHKRAAASSWLAFAKPAKRLKVGDRLHFAEEFAADVVSKEPTGEVMLQFDRGDAALLAALHAHGEMP